MKVLFLETPLIMYLIPVAYPIATDTLTVNLRNESSNKPLEVAASFEVSERLKVTIDDQPAEFKEGNKYAVEIKNNSNVIYKGKIIILTEGTSVQNYEYSLKQNEKFGYKR